MACWIIGSLGNFSLLSHANERQRFRRKDVRIFFVLTRGPCKEAENLRRDFMLGLDLKFRKPCKKETIRKTWQETFSQVWVCISVQSCMLDLELGTFYVFPSSISVFAYTTYWWLSTSFKIQISALYNLCQLNYSLKSLPCWGTLTLPAETAT